MSSANLTKRCPSPSPKIMKTATDSDIDKPQQPSLLEQKSKVVSAVAFYWTVSLTLVFLNKRLFSSTSFDAPLFISWTQFVVTVGCCWVLSALSERHSSQSFFPRFEYNAGIALRVLPLTLCFCGMILCNNLCLKYVDVAFYQVARSLTIIFNILVGGVLHGRWASWRSVSCCVIVVAGYLLGCDNQFQVNFTGICFGVGSSMFLAIYSLNVKRFLAVVGNSSDRLLMVNNMNASLLMPVLFFLRGETAELATTNAFQSISFWFVLLGGGIVGFLINFASFFQIKHTSALTHNVSGTCKAGVQTLIAILFLGETVDVQGALGIALTLGGSFAYSRVRFAEMNQKMSKTNSSHHIRASSSASAASTNKGDKP